jgi:hypothetical protein
LHFHCGTAPEPDSLWLELGNIKNDSSGSSYRNS